MNYRHLEKLRLPNSTRSTLRHFCLRLTSSLKAFRTFHPGFLHLIGTNFIFASRCRIPAIEVGAFLRIAVNIELLSVNSASKAAAISSGRADGVFVFWSNDSADGTFDTPEGVVLTESYYDYDTCVYIGKKIHK